MKKYLIQTITQLKQHPVISFVTVTGTAFAIFLIMLVVMIKNIPTLPFSPESNRDRFLHVSFMNVSVLSAKDNTFRGCSGHMSVKFIDEVYKSLETPEVVTAYSSTPSSIVATMPGQKLFNVEMRETDSEYFKVFDYKYIEGKAYTKADVDSHIPVSVITESTARSLFGTTIGVVGKTIQLNYSPCIVVGVVKDVSILADNGFSQVWVPYETINPMAESSWQKDVIGDFSTTILAKDRSDFPKIMEECNKKVEEYNKKFALIDYELTPRNRPYDQAKEKIAGDPDIEPNVKKSVLTNIMIYAILLIVPAINLASMTHSRLRQRMVEIGVRRAFGSTKTQLLNQIVIENLIITLIGGFIGFIFCLIFSELMSADSFLANWNSSMIVPEVNLSILFQPAIFIYALLFCFILNILSCGIPAWRASQSNIVYSLEGIIE